MTTEEIIDQLSALGQAKRELAGKLWAQLDQLKQEAENLERPLQEDIDQLRLVLQERFVPAHLPTVKTPWFTFSTFPVERWDATKLTAMAEEWPQMLQCLDTKVQSRLLWRKTITPQGEATSVCAPRPAIPLVYASEAVL